MPRIRLLPENRILEAEAGMTLQAALAQSGYPLDAPCGGHGTCGKCRMLVDGREVFACQTAVDGDMTVLLPEQQKPSRSAPKTGTAAAFDIGTTTVACYLLDSTGTVTAEAAVQNPQVSFGADVISRIQAALSGQGHILRRLICTAMERLLRQICVSPEEIETVCVVGNPTMQQLFLGLDVENLAQLPFAPVLTRTKVLPCGEYLPSCPRAKLLVVPDISGFVGADTVAGILSTGLHRAKEITLLVDIGTNGELVLGSKDSMTACATAAGPALEGANIRFGMRAGPGAIDHVWIENGKIRCSVLGAGDAEGVCGSGLIDAVAAALDLGLVNKRGRILTEDQVLHLTETVFLTQEDIRQLQYAKGAIRAGIRLMAEKMNISLGDISSVLLAGAFGSSLNPASACRIGLLPEELLGKIIPVGNAAGAGAVCLGANPGSLDTVEAIVERVEFLELASLTAFPKAFAKAMHLPEDWCRVAKAAGFTEARLFDPAILQVREDIRAMCAVDKCRAYGKNWTCPPECGTLEQCQERMRSYRHGILVQTVGQLAKDIDSRGYRETERQHIESFSAFCTAIRRTYPDALCLGTGGCRICRQCAYPEPCRYPESAVSSMEGYGLFVTQVCRDCGAAYHHGPRTITYTACVLF